MADFLITMQDGSEFLAHHGVLGMKWGVWNDETKAKYGYSGGSAKGDKLRKKAADKRALAEKARSNTALVDRAARAHTGEITKQYSSANAHLVKGHAHSSMAKGLRAEAEAQRLAGKDRKAKRLEKKADKQDLKAKSEGLKEEEARNKGQKAANQFEREQQARQELSKEASKHDAKAAKLEKRAEKADAKAEGKARKALDKTLGAAKSIAESEKAEREYIAKAEKDYKAGKIDKASLDAAKYRFAGHLSTTPEQRADLEAGAHNYLVRSNDKATKAWTSTIFPQITTTSNQQKKAAYEARVSEVMKLSLKDAGLKSKEVDKVIADLLNDKRLDLGMRWGV